MEKISPLRGLIDAEKKEEEPKELGVYSNKPYERDAEYPVPRRNAQ